MARPLGMLLLSAAVMMLTGCATGQLVLPAMNTYFYDGHRLVHAHSGINMSNFTCTMWGDSQEIERELGSPSPGSTLERVGTSELSALITVCNSQGSGRAPSAKNIFTAIYPGTKWCGPGSIADGYDDLGPEAEADTCCRTHDYCEPCMAAGESSLGLTNNSPFTRCSCECDVAFFNCLKVAGTRTACSIGELFFNLVNVKCFKNDHPIVSCKQFGGLLNLKCLEYELDTSQDKIWQFFDTPYFRSKDYTCSSRK